MQVLSVPSKRIAVNKSDEKLVWLQYGLVFLVTFLITYNDLSLPVRIVTFIGLLVFSFRSYLNATFTAFLLIYILFYSKFLQGIPGLEPFRVLFLPYFLLSILRPAIRKFPVNVHLVLVIVFSIFTLKLTADILEIIQEVPLSVNQTEEKGLTNFMVGWYDIFATLSFFYFCFTRLTFYELKKLFNVILLFTVFQGLALLFIVYENPEAVIERESLIADKSFDKDIHWQNPHFGHKNDWGMLFAFTIMVLIIRLILLQKSKEALGRKFLILLLVICLATVAVSLSRQAYVWTLIGSVMIAFGTKSIRYFVSFIFVMGIILIFKPKFVMDRMDSMINVSSSEDFQKLNRKVSDQAWEQAVRNWQLQPRMFFSDWEYNYSEGFWNGMLHQQGILGFLFHVFIYVFMLLRYFAFYKHKNSKLSMYGLLGVTLVFLMFFACVNRRSTHFLHYEGHFTQINILLIFLFSYIELVGYAVKNQLAGIRYL